MNKQSEQNGTECAFPISETETGLYLHTGLTKREHFAGLSMQNLISDSSLSPSEASRLAIDYADALLAELDK